MQKSHRPVSGTQSHIAAPVLGGAQFVSSALREERAERQPARGAEGRWPLRRLRPLRGEAGTALAAARMRREAVLAPSFERGGAAGARSSVWLCRARGEPRAWGDAAVPECSRGLCAGGGLEGVWRLCFLSPLQEWDGTVRVGCWHRWAAGTPASAPLLLLLPWRAISLWHNTSAALSTLAWFIL